MTYPNANAHVNLKMQDKENKKNKPSSLKSNVLKTQQNTQSGQMWTSALGEVNPTKTI